MKKPSCINTEDTTKDTIYQQITKILIPLIPSGNPSDLTSDLPMEWHVLRAFFVNFYYSFSLEIKKTAYNEPKATTSFLEIIQNHGRSLAEAFNNKIDFGDKSGIECFFTTVFFSVFPRICRIWRDPPVAYKTYNKIYNNILSYTIDNTLIEYRAYKKKFLVECEIQEILSSWGNKNRRFYEDFFKKLKNEIQSEFDKKEKVNLFCNILKYMYRRRLEDPGFFCKRYNNEYNNEYNKNILLSRINKIFKPNSDLSDLEETKKSFDYFAEKCDFSRGPNKPSFTKSDVLEMMQNNQLEFLETVFGFNVLEQEDPTEKQLKETEKQLIEKKREQLKQKTQVLNELLKDYKKKGYQKLIITEEMGMTQKTQNDSDKSLKIEMNTHFSPDKEKRSFKNDDDSSGTLTELSYSPSLINKTDNIQKNCLVINFLKQCIINVFLHSQTGQKILQNKLLLAQKGAPRFKKTKIGVSSILLLLGLTALVIAFTHGAAIPILPWVIHSFLVTPAGTATMYAVGGSSSTAGYWGLSKTCKPVKRFNERFYNAITSPFQPTPSTDNPFN